MTVDRDVLALAHRLADTAGAVVRSYFRKHIAIIDKGATGPKTIFDPVTEADRRAEEAMRKLIKAERANDGILGEEHGHERGSSGLTWILDAIDGTRAFITGRHTWGTLIALHDGTRPVLVSSTNRSYANASWVTGGKSEMMTADGPQPCTCAPARPCRRPWFRPPIPGAISTAGNAKLSKAYARPRA